MLGIDYQKVIIARISLSFWVFSLMLPTFYIDGELTNGFIAFLYGFLCVPYLAFIPFFFPLWPDLLLLTMGYATNYVYFNQISRSLNKLEQNKPINYTFVSICGLYNVLLGLFYGVFVDKPMYIYEKMFSLPGYYCWISAFFILGGTELFISASKRINS